MAEKKQDFVVSDRRRFAPEGELRTDVPAREDEKAAEISPPVTPPAPPAPPVAAAPEIPPPEASSEEEEAASEEMPPPPTAAEQQEQTDAYQNSSKKLDELFHKAGGRRESLPEMTFERLVESFYMTALLQMGAIRTEGESPAVDIMGARQTIDSITILQEKTRGNLTEREQTLLQNVLFELRMAWIEITNALASAKPPAGMPLDKK
jgi:type IV secretory pathway VirB10-like protein